MRPNSVALFRAQGVEKHCLVITLSTRNDTLLVHLNGHGGRPFHVGSEGNDVFSSEAEALDHLRQDHEWVLLSRGIALLGYVAVGNRGLVLLATRIRVCVTLPGGHEVKLVTGSKWVEFKLEGSDMAGTALSKVEMDHLMLLREYSVDNAHYFCETFDITRPYPSRHPTQDPSLEFVWNLWLSAALAGQGLGFLCPSLLQGTAGSCDFATKDGAPFSMALLSRRSCVHPGMRYIARGLNALAGPGNESEVEQIIWRTASNGSSEWSNFTWRRGTVPIWWGAELKGGGFGDVGVSIRAHEPFKGTKQYFRRLQKRYVPRAQRAGHDGSPETVTNTSSQANTSSQKQKQQEDPSRSFPIVCINLLRADPSKANDLTLSEHFAKGVRHVKKSEPCFPVSIRNFDWHGMLKFEREPGTVEGLWAAMAPYVTSCGIARGRIRTTDGQISSSNPPDIEFQEQQVGLLRYNCADSLDRTNAASYFIAVQVLIEQCRQLGLEIAPEDPKALPSSRNNSNPHLSSQATTRTTPGFDATATIPLPEGWEQRWEPTTGEPFYIDHNSKQTFWVDALPEDIRISVTASRAAAAAKLEDPVAHVSVSATSQTASSDQFTSPSQQQQQASTDKMGESKKAAGGKYGLFGCSVSEVRKRLHPLVASEHATYFKVNGDMNAYLYTSSRAMHSEILNLLLPQTDGIASSAMGGIHKLNNLSITLQRRWSNVLSDAQRQQTVQLFLGLLLERSLPSVKPIHTAPPLLQDESEDEETQSVSPAEPKARQQAACGVGSSTAENARDQSAASDTSCLQSGLPPQLQSLQAQLLDGPSVDPLPAEPSQPANNLLHFDSDHEQEDVARPVLPAHDYHPLSLI